MLTLYPKSIHLGTILGAEQSFLSFLFFFFPLFGLVFLVSLYKCLCSWLWLGPGAPGLEERCHWVRALNYLPCSHSPPQEAFPPD